MDSIFKLHHIGIVVRDIHKSLSIYERLGYNKFGDIIKDYIQFNNICLMLNKEQQYLIELIEPMDERSTIYNTPYGYHHICYEAKNTAELDAVFKTLKVGKIFKKHIIAPAFDNREVSFACLSDGTLVELLYQEGNSL